MADINWMIFMMRIKKLMMPRLVITESGGLRGWVGQGVGVVGVAMGRLQKKMGLSRKIPKWADPPNPPPPV